MKNYLKRTFLLGDSYTIAGILFAVFTCSGIFGFVYETIFYYFNDGMLLKRGSGFGPWIQLYGWGGLLIFAVAYGVRKKPWLVLINSGFVCGFLEFAVGYALYHFDNGYRAWDYNTEKWNWGNVGGYICIRSVGFFAVSGLLLIYVLVPVFKWLITKVGAKTFFIIAALFAAIFLIDIAYNYIFVKYFPFMDALTFYESLGWPHK